MTTDQIKTKLRRLVADWKNLAEAYEGDARAINIRLGTGSDVAYAKAAMYRDRAWDLEQIIKEEE
jgi:hypothetical protein